MKLNFLQTTALLFSMVTFTEPVHFWRMLEKPLFHSLQEDLDSSVNPKSVFGSDSSRHSNHNSPEVQIIFLIWMFLSKNSKWSLWMILQLKWNLAWFFHRDPVASESSSFAIFFVSSPYSEQSFSVSGHLISSINVPHKNFLLLEKELFRK